MAVAFFIFFFSAFFTFGATTTTPPPPHKDTDTPALDRSSRRSISLYRPPALGFPQVGLPVLGVHRPDSRVLIPPSSRRVPDVDTPPTARSSRIALPPNVLPFPFFPATRSQSPRAQTHPSESPAAPTPRQSALLPLASTDLDLSVPLLTRLDGDHDRAVLHYYLWRISSVVLIIASQTFALFYCLSVFHDHPPPSMSILTMLYCLYSAMSVYIFRYIILSVHIAQREGAFVMGFAEMIIGHIFIITLDIRSPLFHAANCLRVMSFLSLTRTVGGGDAASFSSMLAFHYGDVILNSVTALGYLSILYLAVVVFSFFTMYSPATRNPDVITPLHRILTFLLGDMDDSDRRDGREDSDEVI